jgi:hypothetical protein
VRPPPIRNPGDSKMRLHDDGVQGDMGGVRGRRLGRLGQWWLLVHYRGNEWT